MIRIDFLKLTSFAKGLAIIGVFFVHWHGEWFGWQSVHIFVVLSGFGLAYSSFKKTSQPQWHQWFRKRLRRILPAYWLAVWLAAVMMIIFRLHSIKHIAVRTILDTLLLSNVFEKFKGGATGAFWFVPFILGAYLIFPVLYYWLKRHSNFRGAICLMLGILTLEWTYRAIAIYSLNGQPIAHDSPFLQFLPNSVSALNQQPELFYGLFQRRSPFGFIIARIGEFTVGVLGGFAYAYHPHCVSLLIINRYTGWLGLGIWLMAQTLLYVGLWGWIFSDFAIALGLILWTINLAHWIQRRKQGLFKIVSILGAWSYYIYLTHHPLTRFGSQIADSLWLESSGTIGYILVSFPLLVIVGVIVFGLSWLIKQFDQSSIPDLMIDRLFIIIKNISFK